MKTNFNIEEIFAAATIEQKIIWNDIYLKYGERIAIVPLSLVGIASALETATYKARTMYLAYSLHVSGQIGNVLTNATFRDEADAINFIWSCARPVWNNTAVELNYFGSSEPYENVLFSRVTLSGSTYLDFTGFRLTY